VLPPEMSMPERLQKDVELSGQVGRGRKFGRDT